MALPSPDPDALFLATKEELPSIIIHPDTFLYKDYALPALPKIVHEIQNVMSSDDVSINRISDLIKKDLVLVSQVLKFVNSAYYSLPREVSDIKYAVAFLGIAEVYQIVLSISVINTITPDDMKAFQNIWLHSLMSALCAKTLTKKYEPLLPVEEVWVSALLHDIGKLIYLKFFPVHFKAMNEYCDANGVLFQDAETFFDVPKSSLLGTYLCKRWRLPARVTDACENHGMQSIIENSQQDSRDTALRMVSLGCLLSHIVMTPLSEDLKTKMTGLIKKTLKLSENDFLVLMGEVYEIKTEAEKLLN